jgi:hypothetical protein
MPPTESPLTRAIGVSGVIRFLIALFAVIAMGAAIAEQRYVLAVVGFLFVVVAVTLAYRAWRTR